MNERLWLFTKRHSAALCVYVFKKTKQTVLGWQNPEAVEVFGNIRGHMFYGLFKWHLDVFGMISLYIGASLLLPFRKGLLKPCTGFPL